MRRAWVIGVVVVAAVAVAGGIAWWLLSRPAGPEDAARAYLDALAAGDGASALALVETSTEEEFDAAAALAGATEYLTEPVVDDVSAVESGAASADVTFRLGGAEHSASFGLVERDGEWFVASDALGTLEAAPTIGVAVLVGGVPARSGTPVHALPAVYSVEAAPAGILTGSTQSTVLPGETSQVEVTASVATSAAGLAQTQLDAYAEYCAQPADAVPANCGLKVPWAADLATLTSITFRIDTLPRVTLSPDLTAFDATGGVIVATATGVTREGATATFTYRSDDWALRGSVMLTPHAMQLAVD